MFVDFSRIQIFIYAGNMDMRKQINGLSILVQEELKLDPFSGSLYLFCNKRRNIIKALYWDRNGFCLWQKRLGKNKFPWPKNQNDTIEIDQSKLKMLLDGINFWNAHKILKNPEID